MTKYRNDARAAAEDAELERLESEYRNVEDPVVEDKSLGATPPVNEVNWEKRHGDLRAASQRQVSEKDQEIARLKEEKAALEREATKLPTNKKEAEDWVKEYPDLARVLVTLMEQQTEYVKEDVKTVRQELEAERYMMAREKAMNAILRAHDDFLTLVNEQSFKDWVVLQPKPKAEGGRGPRIGKALYDALYENETDAEAAIEAVDMYKADLAASKPKKDTASREAATSVRKTAASMVPDNTGKRTYSESEIDNMSSRDFDKYEDDIDDAKREGRFVYDITGAAR